MTNLYKDWHKECTVKASDITIDNPAVSQALESGLLMHNNGDSGEQLALQNLSMSEPALCVNGKDVVYLVARKKYNFPVAWILAVDMKNGKVQAVEEFGTQRELGSSIIYYPSNISKYMMTPITRLFLPNVKQRNSQRTVTCWAQTKFSHKSAVNTHHQTSASSSYRWF